MVTNAPTMIPVKANFCYHHGSLGTETFRRPAIPYFFIIYNKEKETD